MFGRIETLFKNCGITGHVYENKDTELNSDVNWDMVDKNILEKQELSKRYLSEVLERS